MKKKFIFLAMILLTLIGGVKWNVLNAQETITIGSGTEEQAFIPIQANYDNTISEQIFLAEDFQGNAGSITSYAFKSSKDLVNYGTPITVTRNFKIYMINTDKASFVSKTDWVNMTSADMVFDGTVTVQPKDTWTTITFDTPFEYENGKNVLLCIVAEGDWVSVSGNYYKYPTTEVRSLVYYEDATPLDATNITVKSKFDNLNYVAQSQFTFEASVPEVMPSSVPEITSIEATHNSVTLSWNAVENAKKYNVYTSTGDLVTTVSETSCTIENLDELTEYCYQVSAVNGEYETAKSTANCATTLEAPADPLVGKQFRLRALTYNKKYSDYYYGPYDFYSAKYLYIDNYNAAGLKVIDKVDSNAQRFTFEPTGVVEGQYYLRSADGYYINCAEWDVSAYGESQKSPIEVVYLDDTQTQFYLTNGTGRHFKVETDYYETQPYVPYCDAAQQYAAKWIVEEVAFTATATTGSNSIFDNESTTLSVTAMDGSGNYTYSWSPIDGLDDATSANPTFSPSAPGTYTFTCTVTDTESNATAEASVTVNVSARPALQLTVSADKNLIYNDDETAVLTATVTEGTGYAPYTYSWTLNETEDGTEATYAFSSETVGVYTLTCTVTDARNNTQTASATIEVKDASERPLEIVLGTPGTYTAYHPTSPLYEYSYSQQIYTASEINMSACDITSISFMKYNNTTLARNIKVFMLNVNKDSFTGAYDWVSVSASDVVFEGSFDFAGNQGDWTTIELTNKFSYTGGDILLCVNDLTGEWKGDYPQFYAYDVDEYRSIGSRRDAASYPDIMSAQSQYREKIVNHIKLGYEIPAPKPENLVATPAQIHVGETTTLTWNELEGAVSYNIYVNGELKDNTTELSYELSGLTYNVEGHTVEVAAVYADDTESGKASVTVQVGGTFTIGVTVTDGTNYIEGAEVSVDMTYAYDEFFNKLEIEVEPAITNEQGFANVTLPLLAKYYDEYDGMWITPYYTVRASKAPYSNAEDNVYCTYISNSQTIGRTLVLTLPTVSYIQVQDEEGNDLYGYVMEGTNLVLSWDELEGATAYKVYKLNHLNETIEEEVITDATYQAYAEYNADGFKYGVSAIFNDVESEVIYTSLIKVIGEGTIKGKVTDGVNPVADALIRLEGESSIGGEIVPDMMTNESGEFEFDVTEGTYTLSVYHHNYDEYVRENVVIAYYQTNDLGTIELTPKAAIDENVTVTADNNGNVSWTGDYTKWNVYRRNTNAPQELATVATKLTTTSTTDPEWETLEAGTYEYGVSTFVEGGTEMGVQLSANFDDGVMPEGWNVIDAQYTSWWGTQSWYWYVHNGRAYSYYAVGDITTYLITPIINTKAATLSFEYFNSNNSDATYNRNELSVKYATSPDGPWNDDALYYSQYQNSWTTVTLDLSKIEHEKVYIAFCNTNVGEGGGDMFLDNIVITGEVSSSIETQIVWSEPVVKQGPNTFEATVDHYWDNPNNWSNGVVPADGEEVIIAANAVIVNGNVNVSNLTINAGSELRVSPGTSLTVTGEIIQKSQYSIVLAEGGQIFQNNTDVTARFEMYIDNPTEWTDETSKDGWQFISMPMTGVSYDDFADADTEYDLYKYDGIQELEWLNHKAGSFAETEFISGKGYLASLKEAETATVYGTLNTSTYFSSYFAYNADKDLANFRLIGNPFTYDIKWGDMNPYQLADGFAIVNKDGIYEYYSGADAVIKVGQGFFIKAIAGESQYSQYNYSKQRSTKASNNSLNITATGNAGEDNVIINLAGKSEGFDKLQNFNDAIATVYVAEDGKNYGIYNCDADVQEIELNFNANQMGNYTISIEPNGKFQTVTLVDRFTGIETNMLVEDYHFTAMSNVNTNRFIIKMVNGQQTTDNSHFVFQSGEDLIIDAEGTVQIIDVMGRVLLSDEVESTNNRINVSGFQNGTYMVRVINGSEVKVEKVVIY